MTTNNTNISKSVDVKYYILSAIGIIIMFGFGFLPAIDPITPLGMRVLGVFIGVIFLWSTVDLLWPSLLALFAFAFVGYSPLTTILTLSLGNDTVWICVLAMAILGVIQRAGVNDYIITFLLTRKICNGRPWTFTTMWLTATALFSVFTGNPLVATLIMWGILVPLCDRLGYKNGEKWPHLMLLGTGAISGFAGAILPFKGLPLYLYGSVKAITGESVDIAGYLCTAVPILICLIVACVLLMRFIFRADISKITSINTEFFKKDLPPMKASQKFLLSFFFAYIIFLAAPGFLPEDSWFMQKYGLIGTIGIVIIMFVFLCIIKNDEQKPFLNFQEIASLCIAWNIVFLLSVAMCLSSILLDDTTGIKTALVQVLDPFFNGLSPIVFIVVFISISILLTNIGNNMVVALVLAPIVATFSLTYTSINLMGIICLLCFSVNVAFILPSASPVSAMMFGHELIDKRRHWGYTIVLCLACLIILIVIGYPLSNVFLG